MANDGWPPNFEAMKRGDGCAMCAQQRGVDDDVFGPLVYAGTHADAYLQRRGFRPGYVVVVHRGERHVTEPTELSDDEAIGYWRDTMKVAAAIERVCRPYKLNVMMLGNQLPHLHTHLVPRYDDDPDAGGPPTYDEDAAPRDEHDVQDQAEQLRSALRYG
jgi:diadenosine tetraphosphate (Ap4A) HIT family hydrolase